MKNSYVQKEIHYQERASRRLSYGARVRPQDNPDRLHLASFLDCFAGEKKVLELGCGNGRFSFLLAEMFPQSRFICTDVCRLNVDQCNLANAYPNLSFGVADALHLPYPDGSFDIVAGFYILHHLPDLCAAVREISRILSPSGCYVGCEPNCYNPYLFLRIASRFKLSPNERVVCAHRYRRCLAAAGLNARFDYFFPRFPAVKNKFLSSCCAISAKRKEGGT